jgi:MFS family permease
MNLPRNRYGMGMSQPEPAMSVGNDALVTIDLSENAGPETGVQKFGRILGGLLLMIIGGVLALACGIGYLVAWFLENENAVWSWADILGEGLLFIGALFLGLAILGFELMRRGRRARKASYLEALATVPGMEEANDTYSPGPVPPPSATPETSAAKPIL